MSTFFNSKSNSSTFFRLYSFVCHFLKSHLKNDRRHVIKNQMHTWIRCCVFRLCAKRIWRNRFREHEYRFCRSHSMQFILIEHWGMWFVQMIRLCVSVPMHNMQQLRFIQSIRSQNIDHCIFWMNLWFFFSFKLFCSFNCWEKFELEFGRWFFAMNGTFFV